MTRRALLFYAIFFFMIPPAGCAGNSQPSKDRKVHKEGKFFTVVLPEGWSVLPQGMGLSPEEKKVYGLTLTAPFDPSLGEAPEPFISAHYYAPDNLVDNTAEKYINVHSFYGQKKGAAFPALPKAEGGKVGGRPAKIFGNINYEHGPGRTLNAKKIEIWESFAVIPLKKGYYALRYSSPAGKYAGNLPVFEAFLASFKPLLK